MQRWWLFLCVCISILYSGLCDTPENVTAIVVSSTSITVTWDIEFSNENVSNITLDEVIRYEVRYIPLQTFGGLISTQTTVSEFDLVVLSNLEEFVQYEISVRAYTEARWGPYSNAIFVSTLQDVPSSPPANVTAMALSSTTIRVSWESIPLIDQNGIITWYRIYYEPQETFEGDVSSGTVWVSQPTMSFLLMNLEEFVEYNISVRAYSRAGWGPYSTDITVRTWEEAPSSPPDNVTAVANSSTSIAVTWDTVPPIDQNGEITSYYLQYEPKETFGGSISSGTVWVHWATSFWLSSLEEFVEYNISVRAYSRAGFGPYSTDITVRTWDAVPSSSPENVTAVANSATSITVTWDIVTPIDQNGEITYYALRYEPQETFGGSISSNTVLVHWSRRSYLLSNLEEFVVYNISVRAYNRAGWGPYSTDITVKTWEAAPSSSPDNVTAVANSSTSIAVTWDTVPPIDQNGEITYYVLRFEPQETFEGSISSGTVWVYRSTMSFLLNNLEEFVEYNISVRAYNRAGWGPYSTETTVSTLQDAPSSPPGNVTAIAYSSTEILATWDTVPLIDQNGIVTHYEIRYETLEVYDELISTQMHNVSGSRSILLSDLEEFVEYEVSVRAYTVAGWGPYSNSSTATTLQDAPSSPPDNVTAMAASSTSITVRWNEVPSIDQNGIIYYYVVRWEPLGDFNTGIRTRWLGRSVRLYVINNLEEFVEYNISVQAYNSAGWGPYSDEIIARTQESVPSSPPADVTLEVNSSTSITVSWDMVPFRDQNGIITMYEVNYEPQDTFGGVIQTETTNVSAPAMSVTISDLEEFVNYNISVRAYTSIGSGPYSSGMVEMTPENAPTGSPDIYYIRRLSSTELQVYWTAVPSIDQNGIITYYNIYYEPLETFNGAISSRQHYLSASLRSFLLRNLEEFVEYTISVRAYNNAGWGPSSTGITARTSEAAPSSPPDNVTAVANSSTSIAVTWDTVPPIDQNGEITYYYLRYEPQETFVSSGTVWVYRSAMFFLLNSLEEFVEYNISVRAYNRAGWGPYSTETTVSTLQDAPSSPPSNVTAIAYSPTEILVTWDTVPLIDQNGIITHYEIRYETLEMYDELISTQMHNVSGSRSILLSDLEEFVEYEVSVRAYTVAGWGPYSNPSTVTTLQDAPSSPPDNVTAMAVSSTSITVRWNEVPSIDQNGIINYYVVRWEPLGDFNTGIRTWYVGRSARSYVLRNLEEFVEYNISVQAYNSAGWGPCSDEIIVRTQESVPSSPPGDVTLEVNSPTSITVSWDMVPFRDQNGIITMYEVNYEPQDTFGGLIQTETTNISAPAMSVTISDLEEFVNYTISVRAYTSVGSGPYSTGIVEMTQEDVPSGSPEIYYVWRLSSSEMQVYWTAVPPIDQNGIITYYRIYYEPLETFNGAISSRQHLLSGSVRSYWLRNLEEFVEYNISVRAHNRAGWGPYSPGIIFRTWEAVPSSPPANVTIEVNSSTSITVSWDMVPFRDQNGIITMYEVNSEPQDTFGGLIQTETTNISAPAMSVTISDLEEFVNYTISIRAYTSVGSGPYSTGIAEMTQEDVPTGAPEIYNIRRLSSTELQVYWTAVPSIDRNGIINYYRIYYEPLETFNGAISSRQHLLSASLRSYVLRNLEEFVEYNISVRAHNRAGWGPYSTDITVRTWDAAPSSPPDNVTAMAVSSTSITVRWNEVPSIDQNGIIYYYVVRWEPLGDFNTGIRTWYVGRSVRSYVLRNLEEFVEYNISVRAYNGAGWGPYSDKIIVRTQESVPSSPPANVTIEVNSPTSITVSWDMVPFRDQNGIITMYEVNYEPQDTFGGLIQTETTNVSAPAMSVTISDLEEFVNYTISVRAYTSVGSGPYSTGIVEMTPEIAPTGSPEIYNVRRLSSTELQVFWTAVPPIDQNGIITYYRIYYEPLENFGGTISYLLPESVNSFVLRNLEEFVEYNISIRAYNSAGWGPYSSEVTARTHEAAPSSPPSTVTAVALSSTSIIVSWGMVPSRDQNGIITRYEVQYKPLETFGGALQSQYSHVSQSMSTVLMVLEEFLEYNITVRAYNNAGWGPYSSSVTATTQQDAPSSPPMNVTAVVASSTRIAVRWSSVHSIDQNGIVIMYEVHYGPLEPLDGLRDSINVTAPTMAVTLTGLQKFFSYTISVRAYTNAGEGPYSSGTLEMTLQDTPGIIEQPPPVQEHTRTSTSVVLEWTSPQSPNGIITTYRINIQVISSDPVGLMVGEEGGTRQVDRGVNIACLGEEELVNKNFTTNSNQTNYTLSELTPYTVYQFSVQAATAIGYGDFSPHRQFVTLESEPAGVTNLTIAAVAYSTISVAWSQPLCPYGVISKYVIYYRSSQTAQTSSISSSGYRNASIMADNTVYSITGLIPDTRYAVHVRAVVACSREEGCELSGRADVELLQRTPVDTTVLQFQLRLRIEIDCTQWIIENSVEKNAEIVHGIIEELNTRCQCNVESSDITSAGFQCFPASPDAVTFRARITGSQQTTASGMIGHLEEWTTTGAFISVQAQLLSADSSCDVMIASFGDRECRLEEPTTQEITTSELASESASSGLVLTGSVIAAAVVISAFVILVCAVVLCLKKKKKATSDFPKASPQEYDTVLLRSLPKKGSPQPQQHPTDEHIYDSISIVCATKTEGGEETYENLETDVHLNTSDPKSSQTASSSEQNFIVSNNSAYGVNVGTNQVPDYDSVAF